MVESDDLAMDRDSGTASATAPEGLDPGPPSPPEAGSVALAPVDADRSPNGDSGVGEPQIELTLGAEPPVAERPEISGRLDELARGLEDLRDLFEARIRSDESQAKALETLHDQLRESKANFVRQEMQPLFRDLIFCYDFAANETEARQGEDAPACGDTARAFDHLRQMIADVLAKYDVEPFRAPGREFDRREQQCVKTVATDVPAEDKHVAAIGAVGFRVGDLIVRKEQVTVYKLSAS